MKARAFLSSGSDVPSDRQRQAMRVFCITIVLLQIPVGVGLYLDAAWATSLWPLPDVRMTYIFLASIVATTATLIIWPVLRRDSGALVAPAINLALATPAIGLYLLWLAIRREDAGLVLPGLAFTFFGATWAAIGLWAKRVPIRDQRRLPGIIRLVFVGFCAILVPVGIALLLQVGNIFPWDIAPENSTVAGVAFLSAAVLFAVIVARPLWIFGEMALASFLAYDVVLAFPYLDFFRNRDDADTVASYYGGASYSPPAGETGVGELSLVIYLAVLAISAAVAVVFFVWSSRSSREMVPAEAAA